MAWGHRPPDLLLRGARVLLGSGEFLRRDVAVVGDRIAAVAEDLAAPGELTIDVSGATIVPGYVEPHTHIFGPLSVGSYLGEALVHGTTCVMSDDSFTYAFLSPEQHAAMLDVSQAVPLVLRWSPRTDPPPRTVPREAIHGMLERSDVGQIGEVWTRPFLDPLDDELATLLADARALLRRVEGHNPGASARTLGVAATAGITADHESIRGEEVVERLRKGLWAFMRHNALRPDVPRIIPPLLESGVSLERTGFTIDWALPPWIAGQGMIDAAIGAALGAGMPPAQAYASATWRPATYMSLDGHVGLVAPGRLACLNVLSDESAPRPERVFSLGREVVHSGELLVPMPEVPWEDIRAAPWSGRSRGPALETYRLRSGDPRIHLESAAIVRKGPGPHTGAPLCCVAIDPLSETFTRAAMYGLPAGLRALVSTLTPSRLLVALGSEAGAIKRCVDEVVARGGGVAFLDDDGIHCLPLPVGGVITSAPFRVVRAFWESVGRHMRDLGHDLPDPISTMLYIAAGSLPGARFTAQGLIDTRAKSIIRPAQKPMWEAAAGG